jgi:LysR family glycine cleavage system transcriptional activator
MALRLPPLNALRAFEVAARLKSVKKAAAELNVTPAAVSHQIKQLEEHLGVELFRRTARSIELTDAARTALPKFSAGFDHLVQGVAALRARDDSPALAVSVAPSFASCWLMPRLHRFFKQHPGVDVRLTARTRVAAGRDAIASEDTVVTTWLADSDVAILYGHGHHPGHRVEQLFPLDITPLAAPALVRGQRPLAVPADLARHTLLHDDTGQHYDNRPFWARWLQAAGAAGASTERGPHFSHAVLALEAAREGLGVVATMPLLAADDLAAGRLVMPFALREPLESSYYLVCAETAADRPAVRAFRGWLHAEIAAKPTLTPAAAGSLPPLASAPT